MKVFAAPRDTGNLVVDFDAIKISLASPEKIRAWSHGEVTKPETINYRTFKPERDGLFCAKIFGPVTDWECLCGKYKRMKHRGVICDKCGVEVTQSKVRRERLAQIELACPVSHVWFFKGLPSRIGHLLDMSLRDLERVLYFESYVVIDPGDTPLKEKALLTEERYRSHREEYRSKFNARMGAEAIKELLRRVDVEELSQELRALMKTETSLQKKLKCAKRLKVVEAFRKSNNRPEWMILDVIPVIPPELRPLVPLDGGRFATSDLNDLYRRVINRNNRLKKLMELKAPDVIVRNEKRMLQEAVDALFDNGRRGRVLRGANNRPLKSLSDTLKGKQGRFRQNLLGKRVDYSGRSVIVVGPELKLHQCGLPKRMALELFKPFIYNKLEQVGLATTIKAAKEMVEQHRPEVWDLLEEVIREHPVLLNRAPTLHRLRYPGVRAGSGGRKGDPYQSAGLYRIQRGLRRRPDGGPHSSFSRIADRGVVVDAGLPQHPVSCERTACCRSIAGHGSGMLLPDQGEAPRNRCRPSLRLAGRCSFGASIWPGGDAHSHPVALQWTDHRSDDGLRSTRCRHAEVQEVESEVIDTTVGRTIFNDHLPKQIPFINGLLKKKGLGSLVNFCYLTYGIEKTVEMLDALKSLGFAYATKSGISIGIDDLVIPSKKNALVEAALREVKEVDDQYREGAITKGERYNKVIAIWSNVTDKVAQEMFEEMERQEREQSKFNPIYMMADSGARGSKQQIRQLAGMRGLMAKPSGEIIETPITSNFREGLTVLQYFISTHGARKGLADTALKTADSGYLTRRLVDVAQDVIISQETCETVDGIYVGAIIEAGEVIEPLRDRIVGRVPLETIKDSFTGETIVNPNQEITEETANAIQNTGVERVKIRSVLTCESLRGVCAMCYGRNLATGHLADLGEAVGVIAAQSIGEPGTQLTMRTFHIGGTASRVAEQTTLEAKVAGVVKFVNLSTVKNKEGDLVVMNRSGQILVVDEKGRERERYPVVYGAKLKVKNGQKINSGQTFVEWDPYTFSILTEDGGTAHFKDIVQGLTVHEEVDEVTGLSMPVIIETQDEKRQPAIGIRDSKKKDVRSYLLPSGAHLMVGDGAAVHPGDVLAKIPRETTKTKDITGGLPRVVELFEARKPKDPAVITEIDGVVRYGGISKGMRKITVVAESGDTREYAVPRGVHINVQEGERVKAGEPLMDGPINPHDILNVLGERALQNYLVNEIQEVYRLQGVNINDKHIEVIVRQMMRWVKIEEVGDTEFLIDETVERLKFAEEGERVVSRRGRPATSRPLLLGITKASLSTDSFISAASFQETTRVLTEASISGRVDYLRGLKENVIMGRLIPAGTGLEAHRQVAIPDAAPLERQPELPGEEFAREVEYVVEGQEVNLGGGDAVSTEGVEQT